MATQWTLDQKRAIDEYGGNILVSAAAGSGKTAVLIERILTIIKEKTDIDKMLIVTFTKAAAAEMRERLYVSLQKELDSEEITPAMAKRLARQQMLLSKSYITTIDSFCKSVVAGNPVESGFDSSFRLADTGEIAVLQADVLEQVLEHRYKEKRHEFLHLVDNICSYKSDEQLESQVLSIYKFSLSYPEPEKWLQAQKESFNIDKITDFTETMWCKELLKDLYVFLEAKSDEIYKCLKISENYGIEEYATMFSDDYEKINSVTLFLKGIREKGFGNVKWEDIFEKISGMSFNNATRISKKKMEEYGEKTSEIIEELKEKRKKCREKINEITKKKMGSNAAAPMDDIKNVQQDMYELIDLVEEFSVAFRKKKKEKHIVTFDDISHGAYQVLSAKDSEGNTIQSDVAKRYSKLFEEVYIDEYQDTNELQDAILYLVSRNFNEEEANKDKQTPNMFMVGDVKQSIYGFRQARPDIFTDKYKKFGRGDNQDKLIVLNKNFRSRQGVIDSVNTLFKKVMTENVCGIAYNEDEYLNFGAAHYPKTPEDDATELYIVKGDNEFESQVAAEKIKELIDSKYQVFDKNTKQMRDIQYRDIVILLRSPGGKTSGGKTYVQSLAKLGIPAYSPESNGFFANAEINILLSFLKIIDNPLQDIHFVATMRNIYGFSDSDIAAVKVDSQKRKNSKEKTLNESFYEMCRGYSLKGELKQNLEIFLRRIEELRKISKHVSVSELLWTLMHENHFYEHLSAGPMGELHVANANVLYAHAIKYDGDINKGLFRFLYFFDNLKKKSDMSEAAGVSEGMNVVRIISIHKSKGLEYPVVILSNAGKDFNLRELREPVLKHRLLGLGPTCYLENERVKYPTVMKACVGRRLIADNKAEEMRVLYVAMTRAAEKLIITGKIEEDFQEYIQKIKNDCSTFTGNPLENSIMESENFLDWITMSECVDEKHISFCEQKEDEDALEENKQDDTIRVIPQPKMTFYKQEYDISERDLPAKISVSELKGLSLEQEQNQEAGQLHSVAKRVTMDEMPELEDEGHNQKLTAAQKGTAVHTCMQLTQYSKIRGLTFEEAECYAEELILDAQDKGFLDSAQAESINRKMLATFYTSELAERIAKADEVMKEIPFTQLEEINSETIAVQGVIDCIIREGDEYTVIDFKTDEVPDAEKYREQLAYYAKAVEKSFGAKPQKLVYFIKYNKQELL